MALTKKTPDIIKAKLAVKAQGVENTLMLTYHNYPPEEYEAFVGNTENFKIAEDVPNAEGIARVNAAIALFLVKSFDDGTDEAFPLNMDGMLDLERHWPGTLYGIIRGYHQSRAAAVEKN
jgi:hypothetical protein